MRSKALVLGALPSPFVGAWIPIWDGESWSVRVEPKFGFEGVAARLDVKLKDGIIIMTPLLAQQFSGQYVRVVVEEAFVLPARSFCVFVDEVK